MGSEIYHGVILAKRAQCVLFLLHCADQLRTLGAAHHLQTVHKTAHRRANLNSHVPIAPKIKPWRQGTSAHCLKACRAASPCARTRYCIEKSHRKVIVVVIASAAAQAAGAPLSMQLSTLHTHTARARRLSAEAVWRGNAVNGGMRGGKH